MNWTYELHRLAHITGFQLLWLIVGVLTLATAAVACVRLLHTKWMRRVVGLVLPVFVVVTAYAIPAALASAPVVSTSVYGKLVAHHWPMPTGKRVVYLTFDDGPDPISTPYILSILMSEHVPAAFFNVGANIARDPGAALIKMEAQDGMIVGDHSYTHPHFRTVSNAEGQRQIQRTASQIRRITGIQPTYFRYPYGQQTAFTESHMAQWGFHHSVYWNVAGKDWFPLCPSPAKIIRNILTVPINFQHERIPNPNLHDGSVVLLHDSSLCGLHELTYLPTLIKDLRARGYKFGLIGQRPYPATPIHTSGRAD